MLKRLMIWLEAKPKPGDELWHAYEPWYPKKLLAVVSPCTLFGDVGMEAAWEYAEHPDEDKHWVDNQW